MVKSMAAVPIKEADSADEAPTERIAGIKKMLEGRLVKVQKKDIELPSVKTEIAKMYKPMKQWN